MYVHVWAPKMKRVMDEISLQNKKEKKTLQKKSDSREMRY